ncbi:MAG: Rpn family recombination-promoting nuclease/putative transposase [Treponema porcinum]|uniref:Rpn family recombination-promoting nuclease/putative transposase n=1 Tax=Treponema porcinum TaxID=261392 RepID=UPI002353AC11|nr:Rpn family recombination-promoting nuclease/putative transposase [Treponema porcinum]MCI6815619.1 Rpn family recombination-promoting nuclease/putative transposase [Treponema porcinum]
MKKENQLTPLEKWERLTFADNFIFCKVLNDNVDICKELLELLLEIKIEKIELPSAEYSLKTDFHSRGVRFDVYVKDGGGRSFDIEIQTAHATSLAKRARYYQGLMDVDSVHTGMDYSKLKESYVIFLCMGDAFGKKLPRYTFRYICEEDGGLQMNDGTVNIFFNARMYDKMETEGLRSFFRFLCGMKPTSDFTDRLSALVERTKLSAQWRHSYMTWEQEMKYQARELAQELAPEIARDMAEDMAKDMAEDMAKDMAEDMAKDMAEDMAKDMAEDMAKDMAEGMAKDMLENVVQDTVRKRDRDTALNLLRLNVITIEQIAQVTGLSVGEVKGLNGAL